MKPSPYTGRVVIADTAGDAPRLWRWLGVAVVLVATLAWWGGREAPSAPPEQARAYASPLGPAPDLPAPAEPTVAVIAVPAAGVGSLAPAACSGPSFELLLAGRMRAQCIDGLRTLQNGSLRSLRAEPSDGTSRWMQIDIAGDEVVSVTVGRAATVEHGCDGADCTGITLGEPDLRGERTVSIDALRLTRRPDAPEALTDDFTLVTARLVGRTATPPGSAADCAEPSVVIDSSASRTSRGFCAEDGTAVERHDDGGRVHRFASLDGPPIVVTTSANGALLRLDYGALACHGAQCAGADLTTTGRDGPLDLALNGTVLTAEDGHAGWASLRGQLRAP